MSGNSHGVERFRRGGFKSSTAREAREAHRSGPFKAYCNQFEKRENPPSDSETPEKADPNASYEVGGETVSGSDFPGGILPANAVEIEGEISSSPENNSF